MEQIEAKYDIRQISLYVYMKLSIIKELKPTFQRNSKTGLRETSSFLLSHLALLLYFEFKFFQSKLVSCPPHQQG